MFRLRVMTVKAVLFGKCVACIQDVLGAILFGKDSLVSMLSPTGIIYFLKWNTPLLAIELCKVDITPG